MVDTQRGIKILADAPGTAHDLVSGLARNHVHGQQERLAGAGIREIDSHDDSDADADAQERQRQLPRVPQHVTQAGSVTGRDHAATSLPPCSSKLRSQVEAMAVL